MIRKATAGDLPFLTGMLKSVHKAAGNLGGFDPEAAGDYITRLIADEASVVLRSDAGMIAGSLIPSWADPDWIIGVELIWWAEDRQWTPLGKAFEHWARDRGAGEIRMISKLGPRSAGINRNFRISGYEPREIFYRKVM